MIKGEGIFPHGTCIDIETDIDRERGVAVSHHVIGGWDDIVY